MKSKSKKSSLTDSIPRIKEAQSSAILTSNNNNSGNSAPAAVIIKKRKLSTDYLSAEEGDDRTKWNLDEKVNNTSRYNASFVKFLDAKEFSLKYFQENGFQTPLVFENKAGLGLRVPSENFKVSDVKACVGSKRIVDVVDVSTQKGLTMTMKDWCAYYENPQRDKLLNVISLEFSHTKLENYVEAPLVVRQLDWIDNAWPQALIAAHTESTNLLDRMMYPKVQKYVLMSVAGCYTDFHVDMGGTSVWYHVLKGGKVFWLIPPTEKNLRAYEKWTLSGEQSNVFLPDLVDECQRIELQQGWTFMLPSGWIHGVYTKKDSLVFGGNFLHSYNIPMQLKVFNIEAKTKVPPQHRYPFFLEIMWFIAERYVHCLTGTTYMKELADPEDDEEEYDEAMQFVRKTFQPTVDVQNLTKYEYEGLRALHQFLKGISSHKRQVPKEILESDELLDTLDNLLNEYIGENTSIAVTGQPITHWPKVDKKFMKKAAKQNASNKKSQAKSSFQNASLDSSTMLDSPLKSANNESLDESMISNASSSAAPKPVTYRQSANAGKGKTGRKHNMRDIPRTKGSIKKRLRPQNIPRSTVERRRRVRCHRCEPCTRDDCGECKYCKDMKKFGGTGVSKQCCLSKQCLAPLLPTTSVCMSCGEHIDRKNPHQTNVMYECEICFEIYHNDCFNAKYKILSNIESIINEDLANCWTCASCISKGFHIIKLEELKKESSHHHIHQGNSYSNNTTHNNTTRTSANNSMNNTINTDSNLSTRVNSDDDYDTNDYDYNSISVSSLSNYERRIILEEFCEIYNENEPVIEEKNFNYNKNKKKQQLKTEMKEEVLETEEPELGINDLIMQEVVKNETSVNNSFTQLMSISNGHQQQETSSSPSSSSASPMSEEPTTISQILQV